ncbi:hypothetical protein ABVT39_010903 [Epinephelus coioides]
MELRREIKGEEVNKPHQDHAQVVVEQTEVAHSLTDALERIQELENSDQSKVKEVKRLKDKCFDLESRSLRQTLRFIGIPEGAEDSNPTKVMAITHTQSLKKNPGYDQ